MSRKKQHTHSTPGMAARADSTAATVAGPTAIQPATDAGRQAAAIIDEAMAKAEADDAQSAPASDAQGPDDPNAKNWGPPYKAIFVCKEKGFEMGENRRYKQRVFIFNQKPERHILDRLKDVGFRYASHDKSWTIQADTATRILSDQLAQEFAGKTPTPIR